ncbi:MAG: hypothetical protein DWH87_05415 [Planctomycetota bacterium]|jgi:hypothetical protein|nr:MAG: hypothetical protein DWH87_05415 [Planctomycetota bacterium]
MKKIRVKTTVGETSVAVSPLQQSQDFVEAVGRALRRSARTARRIARMYGTPIYVLRDGKVVAEKP